MLIYLERNLTMEKIFFTADTHFNHPAILKHCHRPFSSVEEMNESLIENWNKKVGKHDRIYILGDLCFSKHLEIIPRLNGQKHLIIGNHDKSLNQKILSHFVSVSQRKEVKINHRLFVLEHCPLRTWEECYRGSIHLYGHVHGRLKTYNLSFDVGVDTNNYWVYEYQEIMKKVKEREKEMKKNHRIVKNENNTLQYYQDDVQELEFLLKNQKNNSKKIEKSFDI